MKRIRRLSIIICAFFIVFSTRTLAEENSQSARTSSKSNKITTNYINIETLTNEVNNIMLTNIDIEKLIKENSNKYLGEIENITFSHEERNISISFMLDSNNGDVESLLNAGLYNFFNSIRGFSTYDISFEVQYKVTDSNHRVSKQKYATFYFNKDVLSSLDFTNIPANEIVTYADRTSTILGDLKSEHILEIDEMQLKFINILKSYLQYKLLN